MCMKLIWTNSSLHQKVYSNISYTTKILHVILRNMATSTSTVNKDELLKNVFSEENKKKALDFIHHKKTGLKFQMSPCLKRAAVLIPLCYNSNGQPAILYTLRSLKLNSHRGEISFPGGAADAEDNGDDIITALRETEEELGLQRDNIEIWGTMNPMPTASSLMGVTPVIGFIKNPNPLDPEKLKINPDEVHIAFTISLEHFCDPINWGHTQFRRGFGMPIYKNMNVFHSVKDPNHKLMRQISDSEESAGTSDDEKEKTKKQKLSAAKVEKAAEEIEHREIKLWGLTAILSHLVLEALLPTLYTRQVPFLKSSPSSSSKSHKQHQQDEPAGKL